MAKKFIFKFVLDDMSLTYVPGCFFLFFTVALRSMDVVGKHRSGIYRPWETTYKELKTSVADPDPGSSVFRPLDPNLLRDKNKIGIRIRDPG